MTLATLLSFSKRIRYLDDNKNNMAKINYKAITLTLGLIAFSFLFVWYVFAQWTEPTAVPPGDNVPAPLNVGGVTQYKSGALGVGGLFTTDSATYLATLGGNVGIGTTLPRERLQLGSLFVYHDGGDKALGFNAYWDTADGRWEYLTNSSAGVALWYYGPAGWPFRLRVAPGGTAGEPISDLISALTISPEGNVSIGLDFFSMNEARLFVVKDYTCCGDTAPFIIAGETDRDKRLQLGFDTTNNYGWIRAVNTSSGILEPLVLAPDGGNVGIGTTSPASKLSVSTGRGTSGGITLLDSGDADNIRAKIRTSNSGHGILELFDADENRGVFLRALGSSQFISPIFRVVDFVSPSPSFSIVGISNTSPGGRIWQFLSFGETSGHAGKFSIQDANSGGYRLTIDTSGNVGIGTRSPSTRLDVSGVTTASGFTTTSGNAPGFVAYRANIPNNGYSFFSSYIGTDANPIFRIMGWGGLEWGPGGATAPDTNLFRSTANVLRTNDSLIVDGNVGIGTTSPGYKLDVSGSAHASSFPVSSDVRFKTNVDQITNVLDKLDKIQGVSFDWNELYKSLGRSTGHREIGLIAQEVETVFPELVTTWGEENYKAVDYSRMTAVLVEAIKELKAENEMLEQRIEALEEK
ncbi:hypothetical protein LCGC14_0214150 [marine sediment metagenome]|uniref:Peptidase S74 domain-containing protein n=1 Tax=marine sediment metagenome TaxID=412755 RepID=A0A0F9UW71_9ZZZZ